MPPTSTTMPHGLPATVDVPLGGRAYGPNWAYVFAKNMLREMMTKLYVKLNQKKPLHPITPTSTSDSLLTLATSLTSTSLRPHHNRNKVKRAIKLSEVLCAYRCSSTRKLASTWNQSHNARLVRLLRDVAKTHFTQTLLSEERRETGRRLHVATNLKIMNAKKELAEAQLVLAGARPSKPPPQQRDAKPGLHLKLPVANGSLTTTTEAAANVFVNNLCQIMRILRVVCSSHARKHWTRPPWLTTDTMCLNIEETGGAVKCAYDELPAHSRQSLERAYDAPPLVPVPVDDRELESLNTGNPVTSTELRQVLVNSTNYKHAGIGDIPYEALKCMFSNQGHKLSTDREAQLRREGVPAQSMDAMSPELAHRHHVTLCDMKIRRLVTRRSTTWSNAATRRNGLRDTLQRRHALVPPVPPSQSSSPPTLFFWVFIDPATSVRCDVYRYPTLPVSYFN